MKIRILLFIFLLINGFILHAQFRFSRLYEPREIKEAYRNETRSPDGKPGKNYWQNHGKYNITVTVMPPDRIIQGTEWITYYNDSPDTLGHLVIKLLNNVHRPGAVRLFPADSASFTSGIQIDSVSVNGEAQVWTERRYFNTFQYLSLPQPLVSGDSVHLFFKWHYELSSGRGREGMIDSTTYYIAYFYPRVAVYDDYEGWDRTEFNGALEFYSDFNDYRLNIKVPPDFVVWSTGTLLNPSDVLQPAYAGKLAESMQSDNIVRIAGRQDWENKKITLQHPVNTWKWKAGNVPDMAFGVSDHYNWDGTSVVVDDATGRRASAQAAYCDTASDYHYMAGFARHALNWFSHNWPGIPYPYEKTTVFQGYAGMEYPMMVNDESYPDTVESKWVAEHEIAHTYMPFYMGINETRYGFMDEGWATTFELLIGRVDQGIEKGDSAYRRFRISGWAGSASGDQDLPVIIPGTNLTNGLGINEYGKASLGYLAMKDFLGDDLFRKCLQAYMDRWHGKHPVPWDFFYTFNDVASRDLNWFWNNWYFSFNHIDMSLKDLSLSRKGFEITVENTGGMYAPFDVRLYYADGSRDVKHQTPGIWEEGQKDVTIHINTRKKLRGIWLDGGIFMDSNESDNILILK